MTARADRIVSVKAMPTNFQKTVLSNGVRVVTEHMPGVRSAALGIWVTVGSRHEKHLENGISHFIEHMAFKGTTTRSALDIAQTVEQGGGAINAFTSRDMTCFHVHVLDERLPMAFEVLADILRHPAYNPVEIDKEKQVILDEIRDHEDMPDDVAHEMFVKALFHPHPLSRPILGPPENVKQFTRTDVLRFVRSHYLPRRILVSAAGNIKHRNVVAQAEKLLDLDVAHRDVTNGRLQRLQPGMHRYKRPIQQAHVVLGTRALSYGDRERFTLSVLNTVLGGGMSSRLFQNIREKHGIAYSIFSFSEMLRDTGLWGVYLATDPQRVNRAHGMVLDELRKLRDIPLTRAELDGVKMQLKGNVLLNLESSSSRMSRLARMEIYLGRYHSLTDVSRQIDSVTSKRIQTLADWLFNEKNLVTVIVEPDAAAKKKANAGRKA
jgi:predicted Zn-dependent peptidase